MENDILSTESDIAGPQSHERVVRGDAADERPWIVSAPVCPGLSRHHIAHVGVAEVEHPYRVVRRDLSGTFVMACCRGEGRVWLDGRWQVFRAGQACVAPPHVAHAYRATPRRNWEFVWVRYKEPPGRAPVVSAASPMLTEFDGEALRAAVEGLHHEARGATAPALMDAWVELIQQYVERFVHPWRDDDRLGSLWSDVAEDLSRHWTVSELARHAGMSSQQLRRLCRQSIGRTPGEHLAYLRVRHAAALLSGTTEKIATIATLCGFRSAFTFSSTFKRMTGCLPSSYRSSPDAAPLPSRLS